jgi:hypothetical protein
VAGHNDGTQAWVVEGDGCGGRAVQKVQRHAVAPDGGAAFDDDEGAAGDGGERGQRLGRGDGDGDGDGVDNVSHRFSVSHAL